MEFGEKLKIERHNHKMTQENFANTLNVSRTAVSNWENNRNYPDLKILIEISNVLNISLDTLLKDDLALLKKIEDDSIELTFLKKNDRRVKKILHFGLTLSMITSLVFWINYLFFYNPQSGIFPLLGCTFSGLSGLILSSFLENKLIRILLMLINGCLILSFPILLLVALMMGF